MSWHYAGHVDQSSLSIIVPYACQHASVDAHAGQGRFGQGDTSDLLLPAPMFPLHLTLNPFLLRGIVLTHLYFSALPRIGSGTKRCLKKISLPFRWYDIPRDHQQLSSFCLVAKSYVVTWQSQSVPEGEIRGSNVRIVPFYKASGHSCFAWHWLFVPCTRPFVHVSTVQGSRRLSALNRFITIPADQ